jgi:CBS domain-containing protein
MLRELPIREVMVTDVLTFAAEDNVHDAMRTLLLRDIDGAPVLDADGSIVGMLSTADLIVEEARVHLPTVITLLGAYLEMPSSKKKFDKDMEKALGATVGEVMSGPAPVASPDDTVEFVASIMHEGGADRLPVVDDEGNLVGIVSRGDIVRAIVRDFDANGADADQGDDEDDASDASDASDGTDAAGAAGAGE